MVRVYIHAAKAYRAANIMEMYGDTEAAALVNIKHSDEARAAYYRNISGQNWGDPHNYDICLDASMGRAKCTELISNYAKSK